MRFYDTKTIERVTVAEDGVVDAINSGLVPSVSTVLGVFYPEFLLRWYIRNSIKYYVRHGDIEAAVDHRDTESSDFGTVCHDLLEKYLTDGIPDGVYYDPSLSRHIKAIGPLIKWVDQNVEEVISTEESFADAELGYGGTADFLVMLKDGRQMLLDLKCKKHRAAYPMKPSLSNMYQLSAYRNALKKKYGDMEIGNILIAAPVGNGLKTPRLRYFPYFGQDWTEAFNVAYKLWLCEHTVSCPDFTLELT